jgi:hypothetical protein
MSFAIPTMTRTTQRQIALALIVVPIVVCVGMRWFGGRPIDVHLTGPMLHPTSASVNADGTGLVFVLLILIGIVWLAVSLIAQLFRK